MPGKKGYVVTPNPEIAYTALQDPVYRDIINRAALVLPDGIGIIYAAGFWGSRCPAECQASTLPMR